MSMTGEPQVSEEQFLAAVEDACLADPSLTPLGAGLLSALHLDVCHDSRTFSRLLGIAHALVLREISDLADDRGLLEVVSRNERTQRTELTLTGLGRRLFSQLRHAA
jgi:hypothetical protein